MLYNHLINYIYNSVLSTSSSNYVSIGLSQFFSYNSWIFMLKRLVSITEGVCATDLTRLSIVSPICLNLMNVTWIIICSLSYVLNVRAWTIPFTWEHLVSCIFWSCLSVGHSWCKSVIWHCVNRFISVNRL
jgi:hypothetical protein